ncbi:MAG: hypothetical protein IJ193_05460 [Bacilli bacterium]|nr:hypothetical protein [Bacilli bacterium]
MKKVLNTEQNELIDYIDSRLDVLIQNMEYEDYLNFVRGDEHLATYDDVLGYNEINYLPNFFLAGLTVDFLTKVKNIVDQKIVELNI